MYVVHYQIQAKKLLKKTKFMELNQLTAISSVDGRYGKQTENLREYFSEYALIKYRVQVEVAYFKALAKLGVLPKLDDHVSQQLDMIYEAFSLEDAMRVKEIEKTINHDVKAVEYFVKEKIEILGLSDCKEYVHIGLTSQDITNTAIPLMLRGAYAKVLLPALESMLETLGTLQYKWLRVPMLAHTHGQPASPTTVGKELAVFVSRIREVKRDISSSYEQLRAKFGGATGNMNAHYFAFPLVDWKNWVDIFLQELSQRKHTQYALTAHEITTQITPYDDHARIFDAWRRLNTILVDLCQDMWLYISMNYFKQIPKEGEVGSSAMPHKVNPIDFENAEGNLLAANAQFEFLSRKLPVSRLQRDLTDSTITRTIGVPFAHTLVALNSIKKGLGKIALNEQKLNDDLEANWAVVTEGIQTYLRAIYYPEPYEALKKFSRGKAIDKDAVMTFIDSLDITEEQKAYVKTITPQNYLGYPAL